MTKILAVIMLFGLMVSAMAAEMPKPVAARYKSLQAALDKLDAKAFKTFFTEDFVNIDPKGKSVNLPQFLEDIGNLLKTAKSAKTAEKTLDVKMDGDKVAVHCDFAMNMITKDGGTMAVHEVCTDYWRKVKGQWYIYKTVDTVFDVKASPPMGGKTAVGKKK